MECKHNEEKIQESTPRLLISLNQHTRIIDGSSFTTTLQVALANPKFIYLRSAGNDSWRGGIRWLGKRIASSTAADERWSGDSKWFQLNVIDRRSYGLCQERIDGMNIWHPPLSLETISNPVLHSQMSKSTISDLMCPKESSHCCMIVIASPNLALGYNDFLKTRRRAVESCVNSFGLLKGLKGCPKIIKTVSMGGSIPPART
jgi:hypothetical protein